jgi:hypothetical protein
MGFRLQGTAPSVERVVYDHAVGQHFMVVGEVRREAEGNREQPAALRRQIMSRCVGAAHDGGELFERASSMP